MGESIKVDFGFENKLKHAIFRAHWEHGERFFVHVKADGKNTVPVHIKALHNRWEESGGYVPLEFGRDFPRPMALHFDEIEIFVLGMTFNQRPYDVRISWDEVGAIGRRAGPVIAFSSRVEDAHVRDPRAEVPSPKRGEGAEVVNLADRRKKPPT